MTITTMDTTTMATATEEFTVTHDYLREPAAIYRRSREIALAATDLTVVDRDLRDIALRLVHACGEPAIVTALCASPGAAAAGRDALSAGAAVLCDTEMVAHGIIRAALPKGNRVECTLNQAVVAEAAERFGTTRSAAAVDLWDGHLDGAVVAIGNAPTALYRLLERLEDGAPRPAIIAETEKMNTL